MCWFRAPLDTVKPGVAPEVTAFGAPALELLQPAIANRNTAATTAPLGNRFVPGRLR